MVESTSKVTGPVPGPAPDAHARQMSSSSTRSGWDTCPQVNDRRKVPRVDGARTS